MWLWIGRISAPEVCDLCDFLMMLTLDRQNSSEEDTGLKLHGVRLLNKCSKICIILN